MRRFGLGVIGGAEVTVGILAPPSIQAIGLFLVTVFP